MNDQEVLTRVLAEDVTGDGYDDFPLDRSYYNLPPRPGYDDMPLNAGSDDIPVDAPSDDEWDVDEWDVDGWEGSVDPRRTPPPRVHPTWSRDPRWLFVLIGLAAAALVVATVLLVTGREAGENPTEPELGGTRTPASTTSSPSPSSAPSSPPPSASSSTTPTSASSTFEEPGAVDVPAPVRPTASIAELPAEPGAESPNKGSSGPRINVTRTPMSFSPGKH